MDPTRSVTKLNRVTFNKTVAQEHIDHWIVLYCVDWYELCQGLWEDYKTSAVRWEHRLSGSASSWQATPIRFAEVDCATDKALCNENNVEGYPSVQHFHNGKLASVWALSPGAASISDLSKDIVKWVDHELANNATHANSERSASVKPGLIAEFVGLWKVASSGMRELYAHLSWRSPATAALAYVVIIINMVILTWSLASGLELEWKSSIMCIAKTAKHKARPSALFPELPELPEPRSIVRSSIVL